MILFYLQTFQPLGVKKISSVNSKMLNAYLKKKNMQKGARQFTPICIPSHESSQGHDLKLKKLVGKKFLNRNRTDCKKSKKKNLSTQKTPFSLSEILIQ